MKKAKKVIKDNLDLVIILAITAVIVIIGIITGQSLVERAYPSERSGLEWVAMTGGIL